MAKTLDIIGSVSLQKANKSHPVLPALGGMVRSAVLYLRTQSERDIELFIRERGGVMSDDIERVLSRSITRG